MPSTRSRKQDLTKGTRGARSRDSAAGNGDGVPLVAFVHIPKTAGGTVSTMFTAAYSRTALSNAGNYLTGTSKVAQKLTRKPGGWASWQQQGGRVTVGHVPYGVFRQHLVEAELPNGVSYMTFLRDPVERVLSHYYRHFQRRNPARAGQIKQSNAQQRTRVDSIEQALVEMRLPHLNNLATRFLCDDPSPDTLPPSAVEEAKANLREFAFVGIQERFDESMALLRRTFGLELAPYENRHVNAERPDAEEASDEQRALIAEHNAMDTELYRLGVELFEQAVAEAGDGLETDAAQLRALSASVNEEADQAVRDACEWLERELPPGASKPVEQLLTAGEAAGIPRRTLKRASRLVGATKLHRGERTWVRPPAANE